MTDIKSAVENLLNHDNKIACGCAKQLVEASENSPEIYAWFDFFASMLDNSNSYVRNRGIALIAANAKWDNGSKTAVVIDSLLEHIEDEKPITSRQCVKALPEIAARQPQLKAKIAAALKNADTSKYPDSMRPLVDGDIRAAIKEMG